MGRKWEEKWGEERRQVYSVIWGDSSKRRGGDGWEGKEEKEMERKKKSFNLILRDSSHLF